MQRPSNLQQSTVPVDYDEDTENRKPVQPQVLNTRALKAVPMAENVVMKSQVKSTIGSRPVMQVSKAKHAVNVNAVGKAITTMPHSGKSVVAAKPHSSKSVSTDQSSTAKATDYSSTLTVGRTCGGMCLPFVRYFIPSLRYSPSDLFLHFFHKIAPFKPAPCLSFGNVRAGAEKCLSLVLDNPAVLSDELVVVVSEIVRAKGFSVVVHGGDSDELTSDDVAGAENALFGDMKLHVMVPSNSTATIYIYWKPPQEAPAGNMRATLAVKSALTGQRFQVFLLGYVVVVSSVAGTSPAITSGSSRETSSTQAMPKRKAQEPVATTAMAKKPASMPAVPTKRSVTSAAMPMRKQLHLKSKSVAPQTTKNYRPLPYVTRADMYDEHWIDRQEASFTKWLNYELLGGDFNFITVTADGSASSGAHSTTTAPSLDTFSKTLQREQVRRVASMLYQSPAFKLIVDKLEPEVALGRIAVREDCDLRADVGIREDLTNMVLSYAPVWLALGLEVVLGRCVAEVDIGSLAGMIQKVW